MANKIVQLVDKNSNNLYPVAGAVITDAVSTGAISSQAVTNPKIENGAVNGVANDATAIGTAKLALDTVGTPNLRDASVTSDKIDYTTLGFMNNSRSTTMALTTSFQNYLSIDISHFPTGARLLFMVDVVFAGNGTATTYSAQLSDGVSTVAPTNATGTWYTTINMCSTAYTKPDGAGTIDLQVKKDNTNNVNASSGRVSVFRVG